MSLFGILSLKSILTGAGICAVWIAIVALIGNVISFGQKED